jgi:hypothetical protein
MAFGARSNWAGRRHPGHLGCMPNDKAAISGPASSDCVVRSRARWGTAERSSCSGVSARRAIASDRLDSSVDSCGQIARPFRAGLLNPLFASRERDALDTSVVGLRVCSGRCRGVQQHLLSPGSIRTGRSTPADRADASRRDGHAFSGFACSTGHGTGSGRKPNEDEAGRGERSTDDAHRRRSQSAHRVGEKVSRHGDRLGCLVRLAELGCPPVGTAMS